MNYIVENKFKSNCEIKITKEYLSEKYVKLLHMFLNEKRFLTELIENLNFAKIVKRSLLIINI
jgi:hypothetical protein